MVTITSIQSYLARRFTEPSKERDEAFAELDAIKALLNRINLILAVHEAGGALSVPFRAAYLPDMIEASELGLLDMWDVVNPNTNERKLRFLLTEQGARLLKYLLGVEIDD